MKVKIINPVQHDSKNLAPDEVVNLPDAAAALLIECGAVVLVGRAGGNSDPVPDKNPNPDAQPSAEPSAEGT